MRQNMMMATTLSLLLSLLLPQPVSGEHTIGNLDRLHWLCSDYQLPVKGYVVEGWFSLHAYPGMQNKIMKQLQISEGQQTGNLLDGSMINTSFIRKEQNYYIELQLITEKFQTAARYYTLWQSFIERYHVNKPIGVTVIAQLPEVLDDNTMQELGGELQGSLQPKQSQTHAEAGQLQMYGDSPQLEDGLRVGGEQVNYNIAFVQREKTTAIYLGAPVIYQQY